mgnify:CR=1 FL=1
MSLTLAIPSLNWPGSERLPPLDLPSFNRLLQFGKFNAHSRTRADFFADFLWSGSLLEAAKTALSVPQSQAAVLASPVWQQMGMHSMSMLGGDAVAVSAAEADTLCRGLSDFYAADGWQFHVYRPDLWLVTLPAQPDWQVPPVLDVLGQVDGTVRAAGSDGGSWLSIQTEIQMWLHSHAVNQSRLSDGQPAINGVWLWQDVSGSGDRQTVLATDSVWASACAAPHGNLPYDWAAWQRMQADYPDAAQAVWFLPELTLAADTADVWAYQRTLEEWERRFFAPAWAALCDGSLPRLTLLTDGENGGSLTIKAKAGRAFWKKRKPFAGSMAV